VHCPRCREETLDPAPAFCRSCGAPLRLREEPPAPLLDVPLSLDRRAGDRPPAPAAVVPSRARPDEVADAASSRWHLGPAIAALPPEPVLAAVAPAPAAASPEGLLPDVDVEAVEIRLRRPPSWRRVAAWVIDALPFVACGAALARALIREAAGLPAPVVGLEGVLDLVARERMIVGSIAAAVALAFSVYATLAHALAGATLGKRLLRLRIVGPDGTRPSLARSAARSALAMVSAALLGLGFLLALFTASGRSLHDLLARTWVVDAP
jgi:resuscitation-promoting factor RpfA